MSSGRLNSSEKKREVTPHQSSGSTASRSARMRPPLQHDSFNLPKSCQPSGPEEGNSLSLWLSPVRVRYQSQEQWFSWSVEVCFSTSLHFRHLKLGGHDLLCEKQALINSFIHDGWCRGLHGSKNLYPNPKRPVNMAHGTDPDPYFIWKWDPNPCRPEKCLKCTTRTRRGPDHYSKVGTEPGWEDTDPTAPVPIGTYCTANAMKSINMLRKKQQPFFLYC